MEKKNTRYYLVICFSELNIFGEENFVFNEKLTRKKIRKLVCHYFFFP